MSFNAAELVATIRLDGLDSVGRDLSKVRDQLTSTDSAATKVGRAAKEAFVTASAQIGTATVAAGVFIGKLAATGVAYNQLQQTSRAALRTLLGGAEQANAQMDKLDAFAKNSPFSKSVFIQAQQQLIGFGYEAQKVIPILDAVQNAVAAVGGSNQQISEIVSILAKIRSSGKLTAEDLNMLGERGLDAATLLGQGFGKTAADIRQDITDGALDAGQALDVLVSQMGTKFAGAASGVKETFAGTTDRIKAASRDIGAALAEPFVAKNGGGLAVTWGNQVADVLRAVEKHVGPVVTILTGRAAPAFAEITSLLDRARVQVKSWDSSRLEGFLDSLGQHGPAVAAVAGAMLGVNTQLLRSIPIVGALVPGFGPLTGVLAGIAATSPEVRSGLVSVMEAARPLATVAGDLARVISASLNAALPVAADGLRLVAGVAGPLVDLLAEVPAPVLVAVGAFVALQAASKPLTGILEGAGKGLQFVMQHMQASAAVSEAMGGQVTVLGTAFRATGTMATSLGNSMKAAFISNPVGLALIAVSTAAAILTAAFSAQAEAAQDTKERVQGYKDTLDQTNGAILRATRAQVEKNLADEDARSKAEQLGVSYNDLVDAILGQPDAIKRVTAAIEENGKAYSATTGVQAGYTPVANDLIRIFNAQSDAIADAADETRRDAEEKRKNAAAMSEVERSNTRMNEALAIARDVSRDATERLKALKQALDELNGGTKSQADVTRDLNEQTDRLREVLTATNEAGEKLAPGLINAAGAIDTTSAAGRALYDEVGRLNDQMLDAILLADKEAKARGQQGISVDEARAIYERFSGQLSSLREAAGLSEEQMSGLVSTMLQTPEVVAFAVQDDGTVDAAKLRLIDLATQIVATPNGQFEVSSDDFPGLEEALRLLGTNIRALPDGTIKVKKDDGSFQTVEQALNELSRARTSAMYAEVRYANGNGSGGLTRASGGPIFGPGTSTSDSVPVMASDGEHMWTAAETNAVGGHGAMFRLRRAALAGALHLAEGGPVLRRDALPAPQPVMLRTVATPPSGQSAESVNSFTAALEALVASGGIKFEIVGTPGMNEDQLARKAAKYAVAEIERMLR